MNKSKKVKIMSAVGLSIALFSVFYVLKTDTSDVAIALENNNIVKAQLDNGISLVKAKVKNDNTMLSEVYYLQAQKEVKSNKIDLALDYYTKSFEALPNDTALLSKVNLLVKTGEKDKAIEEMKKYDITSTERLVLRAQVYEKIDEVALAISDLETAKTKGYVNADEIVKKLVQKHKVDVSKTEVLNLK